MTRTITQAFTDYPDGVLRPVTLLAYDNNKYATVRHADGREDSVKRGYIYADPDTKRPVADIHWHVIGGGRRHTYARRARKTTYRLFRESDWQQYRDVEFRSKAAALRRAVREAAAHNEEVTVTASVIAHQRSTLQCREVVVTPAGDACELRRHLAPKYLRGFGKRHSTLR